MCCLYHHPSFDQPNSSGIYWKVQIILKCVEVLNASLKGKQITKIVPLIESSLKNKKMQNVK